MTAVACDWRRTLLLAAALASLALQPPEPKFLRTIHIERRGEVRLVVRAGCSRCDWGAEGREAAVLKMSIDGKYSQHLPLVRGHEAADYPVALGELAAGDHSVLIERDGDLSAAGAGALSVDVTNVDVSSPAAADRRTSVDFAARSMAPILYARPNTVGRFTDVPLLMWHEIVPTPRGRQLRYSVIFSNEDGGTPTDRLMATWGRTTDIEFVYGVELDENGRVLAEEFQGPGHEVPPFRGRHEGRHPLLWVSTDNNMVSESGPTTIRYAPASEHIELEHASRELVMDRHPWTYAIAAKELMREGKIDEAAAPGSGKIPDPRRFVFLEACSELREAALAFAVRAVDGDGIARWYESDRGMPEFRIVRSGCFRGAVPLPPSTSPDGIRFQAYSKPRDGAAARGSVVVTRINSVFRLGPQFLPEPALASWTGSAEVPIDGKPMELPFPRPR